MKSFIVKDDRNRLVTKRLNDSVSVILRLKHRKSTVVCENDGNVDVFSGTAPYIFLSSQNRVFFSIMIKQK